MTTATLHDGNILEVTTIGDGHPVLMPVSAAFVEGEAADSIRAWGGDPNAGHGLAHALAEAGFQAITADYEGHLMAYPKERTLTAEAVTHDLLAIAAAGGAERFAYYGYSWLAMSGLQLAIRSDRLTALAMGGFPPLGGPYAAMLAVTHAAHRVATEPQPEPVGAVEAGDWDTAASTQTPAQTGQFATLYESLRDFDDRAAAAKLDVPRLAFAGERDNIDYPPKWGGVRVELADPLLRHREELALLGWTVELIPEADHLSAMHASRVAALLIPWLRSVT
jgi:hypothetical protein